MPKTSRSQKLDFKGLEIIADEFTGKVNTTSSAITALVALTDSSGGGAPNNTLEVVPAATAATTDTSAASLTSTNAALTAIKNDIADLAAKVNAIIAALKA